ncbi:hypothetical protein MPTK1_4g06400 [Marchantia polymorpha subsp. ruderalis]|uniref:Uncharacterized protein n=2 Tax=Marchantia polymorpha TaxID=3197 RepID=A0AAF6B6Z5_MARPO|nr:hypothetical protein MARPO_0114s0013 [Marchantia polymorpha]BBN07779.1 hypothetical protein Mp_4g06400 [Marchantia polymorpha subsp. ruderalis]|eukprot:PTQ31193.1 hypothetical protein MARPO_0114s0013 [Marchantia polymorpha]
MMRVYCVFRSGLQNESTFGDRSLDPLSQYNALPGMLVTMTMRVVIPGFSFRSSSRSSSSRLVSKRLGHLAAIPLCFSTRRTVAHWPCKLFRRQIFSDIMPVMTAL